MRGTFVPHLPRMHLSSSQIASIENIRPSGNTRIVCRYSIISGDSGALFTPSAPQHRGVSLGSGQNCFRIHPGRGRPWSSRTPHPPHPQPPTTCNNLALSTPLRQVNCISTEFTPRKHGGEKGVPFRIQVDTFTTNESGEYMEHVHSSSCQIKVFKVKNQNKPNSSSVYSVALVGLASSRMLALCLRKPKGADRKLKTDREKTDKKSPQDREKYQLSHDTTLLKEVRSHVPGYIRDHEQPLFAPAQPRRRHLLIPL